jgi:hypothetical protein
MTQPGTPGEKEPFLAVLEYILIPKYINFYGKVHSLRRMDSRCSRKTAQSVETNLFKEVRSAWLISIRNQALKGTQWMPWC